MPAMFSDRDNWLAANLLITEHGDLAEIEACRLADLMLDHGNRSSGNIAGSAKFRGQIECASMKMRF